MTLRDIGHALRNAFAPCIGPTQELRDAIRDKQAAGDRLMLVGAGITAAIDGHNDIHRSVVEATACAGEFR